MSDTFRVLVVDDDILVASSVARVVETMGCAIVGPCFSLGQARDAARSLPLDAALLDVNLGRELVYPLAADLQAQKIPFAFLTGMRPRDIPPAFASIPVLPKPCADRDIASWVLAFRRRRAP